MFIVITIWIVSAFFSFGFIGLNYVLSAHAAKKPWRIKKKGDYSPKISIIVPTYNEAKVIEYKLKNLAKLKYPQDRLEMVFVDSNSQDSTVNHLLKFAKKNKDLRVTILVEKKRRGKSAALNAALKRCEGNVIVISDADCFWPSDILMKSLPFLTDPTVGAVSGPKKLLNSESSSVTKSEEVYLRSMNLIKLGESKFCCTMLFEGGFSAYKREILDSFDPYNTGSDDCGTLITLFKKKSRAIMVQEAEFFTTFPETWNGKIKMKKRRANQLVRLISRYALLLFSNKVKIARGIVTKNIVLYLVSPFAFVCLLITTVYFFLKFPLASIFLIALAIPKLRLYFIEVVFNYSILLQSMVLVILGKRFKTWKKPLDRMLLEEKSLLQRGLI